MRAINLLPDDERRGTGGAGGRSGGAAQLLIGLLAVLVLVVSYSTVQKRSLSDKRAEVATLEAQAVAAEARTVELSSFVQFSALRAARTQTVSSLASSRFDWSHAMRELARVIPKNVWLTGLQGTVAPGVTLKAAAGQVASLRAALPVPAVELVGCTTDQTSVARMVTRMRLIDGVTRVALQSSVKEEVASSNAGPAGENTSGDCRQGDARFPQFALVAFFDPATGSVPTEATGAGQLAASAIPSGTTGATAPTAAAMTGVTP